MHPLEEAILSSNLSEVKALLEKHPEDIDLLSDEYQIPLTFLAARTGSFEIVKYIVEYSRASMNLKDQNYRSILHHAVLSDNLGLVIYLVERVGISPTLPDKNLITPFQLAHDYSLLSIETYFTEYCKCNYLNMYHNPIRTGMFPDPSIVRVENDYYMVNSSFIFFPAIPISHSTDLIHWEIIGHAITNPEWAALDELEGGRGYWAPDISYDGECFYITATYRMNDTGSTMRKQIVVSSKRPEGPYSKPSYIDEDGIDPSIFRDDDGRCYMLLNRGARIFELSPDATKKISNAELLYYGDQKRAPEGPHLLKKDGWYYLFEAEGGTGPGHRITVSRSKSLKGIYSPCPYNPIMRQWDENEPIQRCGHGKPVQTQNGDWYMVYLCGRMINGKYSILGRETALDPITWTPDGWPIVNRLQGPSALQEKPVIPFISSMQNDFGDTNQTIIYYFDAELSYDFMTPRAPEPDGIILKNGFLYLKASKKPLYSMLSKNILVRRQTDFCFTASSVMRILPLKEQQNAGMTCYYDENTYLTFGLISKNNLHHIFVYEYIMDQGNFSILKSLPLNTFENSFITFTIKTNYLEREFYYQLEGESENFLGKLSNIYYLCDEGIKKGKRFTGAMIGMYAENNTNQDDYYACFSSFSYRSVNPSN